MPDSVVTDNHHLVWIDLEMTGLDPERDVILEIATIVTDNNLDVVAEGPVYAIAQPAERLHAMNDWSRQQHGASGLLDRVRASGIGERQAEVATLEFLRRCVEQRASPLCGNTIWQDRRFLARHMPELEGYFHYRNIDVSSVKELVRRWRPDLVAGFTKKNEHTALADIRESIAELVYYREHFFRLRA